MNPLCPCYCALVIVVFRMLTGWFNLFLTMIEGDFKSTPDYSNWKDEWGEGGEKSLHSTHSLDYFNQWEEEELSSLWINWWNRSLNVKSTMTVSYTGDVGNANVQALGKLLWRWKGSIWKVQFILTISRIFIIFHNRQCILNFSFGYLRMVYVLSYTTSISMIFKRGTTILLFP